MNIYELEEEKYFVSLGMKARGGSFVQALGETLSHADYINTAKIKLTFNEYWNEYLEIGKKLLYKILAYKHLKK